MAARCAAKIESPDQEAGRTALRLPFGKRPMERLHTSLRSVPPHVTLGHAKAWADLAGIHAIRDITAMDCLGVPVFASERRGSSAPLYTFGKGRLPIEAEVGAYMEAIESYFSEPGIAPVETRQGRLDHAAILEFAPRFDSDPDPERPLMLARAEDMESGIEAWIPAEIAFNPAPTGSGPPLFGSSSNGLASGNSLLEASIHALYELIERDVWSMEFLRNRAVPVEAIPSHLVHPLAEAAARNGLRLAIRHVPNDYGIPFFAAFLFDPVRPQNHLFNGGWGCHPVREVALTRALAEVAQSRVAFLSGFREAEEKNDPERMRKQIEILSAGTAAERYEDIPNSPPAASLEEQWTSALGHLRRVIDRPVYRVVYTPPEGPLHVVRLVVPTLEHFTPSAKRMGPRMRAELEKMALRRAPDPSAGASP